LEWAAHKSVAREGVAAAVSLAGNSFVGGFVAEVVTKVVTEVVKSGQHNERTATGAGVAEYARLARKKPKHR
jgi:hypothetical protein